MSTIVLAAAGLEAFTASTGAVRLFAWTPHLDIEPALAQGSVFFSGGNENTSGYYHLYKNGLTDS